MTFAREEVLELMGRRGAGREWYAELEGVLRPDVANPVDDRAVDVVVDSLRIGCLPSYLSGEMSIPSKGTYPCKVQVFARDISGQKVVAAWVWLGPGKPQWEWSRKHFPPMTTFERSRHNEERIKSFISKEVSSGGYRTHEIKRGMVDGTHYLELVEPIKRLKREGKLEEALSLCYKAIEGAENDRGDREPARAYTIDAAIIHRKLGQRKEEIAVLKRWMRHCPKDRRAGSEVAKRLEKLTSK